MRIDNKVGFNLQRAISYKDNPREYIFNGITCLHLGVIFADNRHFMIYLNNQTGMAHIEEANGVLQGDKMGFNLSVIPEDDLWEWLNVIARKEGIL